MPTLTTPADMAARPFLSSRRTRNKVSEIDRARLAWWYVTASQGGDRNPARTLADRFPESSYKTWANVFSQARAGETALLTRPPRRGVAGGFLTEHAEQLLSISPPILPAEVEAAYLREREVYAPPVRGERRVAPPRRSDFDSDADYHRTFDQWDEHAEWRREVEMGPEEYEDVEDWEVRMRESDDAD